MVKAIGEKWLEEYRAGEHRERRDYTARIRAKCYECTEGYALGKKSCGEENTCPLYPFMPYKNSDEIIKVKKPRKRPDPKPSRWVKCRRINIKKSNEE